MDNIRLEPLTDNDTERFVRDNQEAFRFGAMEEFGLRYDHTDENGEIISEIMHFECNQKRSGIQNHL